MVRAAALTEWQLQERLTARWVRDGVEVDGERHMLVAWEVMAPSWGINDSRGFFGEPSVDFLAADRSGRLLAVELKLAIRGTRPAWRALCQVTHRAMRLAQTFSLDGLERAYLEAAGGLHGRVGRQAVPSLAERHRQFFGLNSRPDFGVGGFGRAVAALEFGPSWGLVLSEFNALAWPDLMTRLSEQGEFEPGRSHKEPLRLRDLAEPTRGQLAGPIVTMPIPAHMAGMTVEDLATPLPSMME